MAAAAAAAAATRSATAVVTVFGAPPIEGLGTPAASSSSSRTAATSGLGDLQRQTDDLIVARGNRTPGLAGLFTQLPGQHAAAVPRHRPDQGRGAGRVARRRQSDAAGLPRLALRQRLQRVRPTWQVNVQADGRVPRPGRGHQPAPGPQQAGQMVPLGTLVDVREIERPGHASRATTCTPPPPITGNAAPGRQLRPGDRRRCERAGRPRRCRGRWRPSGPS